MIRTRQTFQERASAPATRTGYPHVVLHDAASEHLQARAAYELPRTLVADLNLPLWVEEGLCRLTPVRPQAADDDLRELAARYGLRDFWSGQAL
ncbi:hypothetical protein IV102_24540 [bacterium]|nr:hypothetical protein [bacterium]